MKVSTLLLFLQMGVIASSSTPPSSIPTYTIDLSYKTHLNGTRISQLLEHQYQYFISRKDNDNNNHHHDDNGKYCLLHCQPSQIVEIDVSPSFDYDDLAMAANNTGLIQFNDGNKKQVKFVTRAIQHHQEKELKLSTNDFQKVCPLQNVLDEIWNISLASEMELYPSLFVNYALGESNLRRDFESVADTSLCVVDVEKTLQEETWQTFFKSLQIPNLFQIRRTRESV